MNENEMEKMEDLLMKRIENIPPWVAEALHRRAMSDAKKLFEKEDITLEDIAYVIYRSFNLGLALGMKNNDRFKENNEIE